MRSPLSVQPSLGELLLHRGNELRRAVRGRQGRLELRQVRLIEGEQPDRSAHRANPGPDPRRSRKSLAIARLASCAAMSRSAFAQRFRSLVGQTPVSYLATWRMQKAAYLLEMGSLSIAQIAKAFRRRIGIPQGRTHDNTRKISAINETPLACLADNGAWP